MENSEQETEQDTGNDHGSHIGFLPHAVQKGKLTLPSSFRQKWFADPACTSHVCNERNDFETLDHSVTGPVEVGEGQQAQSLGLGTIRGSTFIDGKRVPVIFNNVLFVPTLICNLISMSKARRSGFRVTFDEDKTGGGCFEVIHRATGCICMDLREMKDCMRLCFSRKFQILL